MLRIIRERILPKIGPLSITIFLVICLAAVAAGMGVKRIRDHVVALPEFRVKDMHISKAPAWAPREDLEKQILKALPKGSNMFDRNLPKKMHEACKDFYWIERIESIRKVYPSILELKMKLRTPAAYVLYRGAPYLVGLRGTQLENGYYRKPSGDPDMFKIKGLRDAPPGVGEKWVDYEALEAALAVVRDISSTDLCRRVGVTTVDVSNFKARRDNRESHVDLITKNQTRILWGYSSAAPGHDALTSEEKLSNLAGALSQHGSLDQFEYVKVCFVKGEWTCKPRGRQR